MGKNLRGEACGTRMGLVSINPNCHARSSSFVVPHTSSADEAGLDCAIYLRIMKYGTCAPVCPQRREFNRIA